MLSAHRALIGRASWAWRNSLHSATVCSDASRTCSGSAIGGVTLAQHAHLSRAIKSTRSMVSLRAPSAVMELRSNISRHLHTGIGLPRAGSSSGGGSCCKHDAVKDKTSTKSECSTGSTSFDTASDTGGAAALSGAGRGINWRNLNHWKRAGVNTSWCLLGCSIGEFGTLAAFGAIGLDQAAMDGWMYYALAGLPLVNGLVTSVALETALLARGSNGLPLRDAFETAVGMSFISMLMMEVAMEAVDLWFTGGALCINPVAMPLMLAVGWATPLPYNYYKLEKFGKSCH